jgi:hypothetical protein
MVDGTLSWKNHVEILMKKLSKSCYVIKNMKHYMSISVLKVIYYSFSHSLMSYGIIFWGNSSYIFFRRRLLELCCDMVKHSRVEIYLRNWVFCHLRSNTYFLYYCSYRIINLFFSSNIDSHTIATRQSQDLYLPQANLTVDQKGVYYAGIKMFNKLPTEIKSTYNNFKRFKVVLRRFLLFFICIVRGGINFILWMNI